MALLLSLLGVVVSLGFIAAGAVMNWRYGLTIGRTPDEQQLNAAVQTLIDICKVMLPFFGWWAWARRHLLVAGMSLIAMVACVTYSAIGVAAFVDMSRATTSGQLIAKRESVEDWRAELGRTQRRLSELGSYQPASVVSERIEQQKQDVRWTTSRGCTDATLRASREFCVEVNGLEAEKAKALEAEKLETRGAELREKINSLAGQAAIEHGDPRGEIIARATGWDLTRVQTWLALLFVGIVELMATFGIFLSLNHGELTRSLHERRARRGQWLASDSDTPVAGDRGPSRSAAASRTPTLIEHQPVGQIIRFIAEATRPAVGGVEVEALHAAYKRWCEASGVAPVDQQTFEAELDRLRALPEVGDRVRKWGTRYLGIALSAGRRESRGARQ